MRTASGKLLTRAQSAIAGSTPTLQQVLTAGSTLTGDNTINIDAYRLTFAGDGATTDFQLTNIQDIYFSVNDGSGILIEQGAAASGGIG